MAAPRDDHELLRAYVERRDDAAFAELVARHADMVYAAATRQVGRSGLAEDVTQAAFILLARKASRIGAGVVVAAWLHKATRYSALNAMRIEQRRRVHERMAGEQAAAAALQRAEPAKATASLDWAQGAVLLDDGVARLGKLDREAVVLRFLERRSYADVARALGVSEEAAQMRVSRAIEKLRMFFRRHGLTVSAAVLRAAVNASAVTPAPSMMKMSLASSAIQAARPEAAVGATSAISIADSAGAAMRFAALRAASTVAASGLAAAVLIGFLLWKVALPGAGTPPPLPSAPERSMVLHEAPDTVNAADASDPRRSWAAGVIMVATRRSELLVPR